MNKKEMKKQIEKNYEKQRTIKRIGIGIIISLIILYFIGLTIIVLTGGLK